MICAKTSTFAQTQQSQSSPGFLFCPRRVTESTPSSSSQIVVAYHGTKPDRAASIQREKRFRPSTHGTLGPGVYVSEMIEKAQGYGSCLFELRVRLGRILDSTRASKTWQAEGFDSCRLSGNGRLTEICVKNPNQIEIVKQIK